MLGELLTALGILAVCLVIHVVGLVYLLDWLIRRRQRMEDQIKTLQFAGLLGLVFTALVIMHLFEAGLWAGFYALNGLFADFETSLYFSLTTYASVGYGDVLLPQRWRLLGTIEGITGVLLCGLSTALLFAILDVFIRIRRRRKSDVEETVLPDSRITNDGSNLPKVTATTKFSAD